MPKKLTKTQVKRKLKSIKIQMFSLALDKISEGSKSYCPISSDKLLSMHGAIGLALNRVK